MMQEIKIDTSIDIKDKIVLNEKILNELLDKCGLSNETKDWWLKTIGNDFPINQLENIDGDIKGYIKQLKNIIDNTEFDRKSNIKTYTSLNGISRTFEYDKNNNMIKMKDSDGYYKTYEYDKNNNLISFKDSTGVDETYKYKKLFNEIKIKLFSEGKLQNQCSIPITYRKKDIVNSIDVTTKEKSNNLTSFSLPNLSI